MTRMSVSEQRTLRGRNSLLSPVKVGAFAPPKRYGRNCQVELIDEIRFE